jgi:hypothetical protein
MEYTNGINLIREVKNHKVLHTPVSTAQTEIPTEVSIDCNWKVIHYKNSVIVGIYYTPAVHLKPMKISLSNDELSYWIQDAVPYEYKVFKVRLQDESPQRTVNTLYIGKSERFNDADETIDYVSLKLCPQEEIKNGKKAPRKRTKVCSVDKQATGS